MISCPEAEGEEQLLSSIAHKCSLQNTAILIKDASCSAESQNHLRSLYQPHRFSILAAILGECLAAGPQGEEQGAPPKFMVIAVQGRKDIEVTVGLVRERFGPIVHGLDGHADIVEFSGLWQEAQSRYRILVTSAQSMMYLFCHGLLRMSQISHLFFDDCTLANSNHPYCLIMRSFYLPGRARILAKSVEAASEEEIEGLLYDDLPRVVLFGDWPLVGENEGFLSKRDRIAKLLEYLRLFLCVIRPLASDLKAPEGQHWLGYDELIYLKDSGTFEQLQSLYLRPGPVNLQSRLECAVDHIAASGHLKNGANVLVLVGEDSLSPSERLLGASVRKADLDARCETLTTSSIGPDVKRRVLLYSNKESDLNLLAYFLQQQTSETLVTIYIVEPTINPSFVLTLMAYSKQIPLCTVRASDMEGIQGQAIEMLLWMTIIGASSPVDSTPFRKLRAFMGGFEAIAKSAYLIPDVSAIHRRVPATGALISTATSIQMLLCACSYLPHFGSSGTGLRIQTMAVKRVTKAGVELDKERHYYMTKITLPPSLKPWLSEEQLSVTGPVTPSRFSSQTLASNAALSLMYDHRIVDDKLMISMTILNSPDILTMNGDKAMGKVEYDPFENEEIDENGLVDEDQLQEIIPETFQFGPEWKVLKEPSQPQEFYAYAFNYSMNLLDEAERYKPVGIKSSMDETVFVEQEDRLPPDTLIHLCDESFLNTSNANRSFTLIVRSPLKGEYRPSEIRIGATVILRGNLEPLGPLMLNEEQIETLKAFQALTFGLISTKQYPLMDSGAMDKDEVLRIPDHKQTVYFIGLARKKGGMDRLVDPFDMESCFGLYARFLSSIGQTMSSQLQTEHVPAKWSLDWEAMGKVVHPERWPNLREYVLRIREFKASNYRIFAELGEPPVFDYPNDPSRESLVLDFEKFCLRRLSLYTPFNGLFYRAKQIDLGTAPVSPFESAALPDCGTYAGYMKMKYGLAATDEAGPMVQVKRTENFFSFSKWLIITSRAKTNSKRHRSDRLQQTKSLLIAEFVKIIPLPYVFVRMANLLPRAVYDVERQSLIYDFYTNRLPGFLADPTFKLDLNLILVDSMTGPTSSMTYDFERLEILGDSFLKLATSMDVFLTFPLRDEGKLSSRRQDLVCNSNLYRIATELDIYRFARLTPFFAKLWCPPDLAALYTPEDVQSQPHLRFIFDQGQSRWKLLWEADQRAGKRSALFHLYPDGHLVDRGAEAGERIALAGHLKHLRNKSAQASMPALSRFGHPIPPKVMADLLEALIGAIYKASGIPTAIDLLRGFGLLSDAMLTYGSVDPTQALGSILGEGNEAKRQAAPSKIVVPSGFQKFSDVQSYVPTEDDYPYEEIEAHLGYKFRNRRLLFVAMTHSSVDVTNSNERLEWLGDAALDWVITEYFWEQHKDEKWMTPARITVCRQAAVCNEAFSRVAVHSALHKYLRIDSAFLQVEIEKYVQAVMAVEQSDSADPEGPLSALSWNTRYTINAEDPSGAALKSRPDDAPVEKQTLTIPPAPKALGDLFEGIAGAVFLDLSFDIQEFGRVFLPLTRWYLDRHADPYDLPENPISDFWHDYMAAGIPPTAIEFRYCTLEEVLKRLADEKRSGKPTLPEKSSTATCQILVRGRVVAEATAPNRVLARKFATRQAVIYIRSSGWRDFLS